MTFDIASARAKMPGRRVDWHSEIDTTMREAARLALEGAPAGTVVGAEMQWMGQGRHGRTWHSPEGEGLYFTMLLRPNIAPRQLPVVTLALGVAVADVLKMLTAIDVDLRWPNDVMAGERKVCGILTQLQDGAVLAGIGLNVNQESFPGALSASATSLRMETGREFRREPLLAALVTSIESNVRILETSGAVAMLTLFSAASSYAAGRRVTVDLAEDRSVTGTTAGLTADGFLKLRLDDGSETVITAGGVRPSAA
jgi:BirA family biotin operon repressor/biotin-[acetyl-CoA-carboxylase] ligase